MIFFGWKLFMERPGYSPVFSWIPQWEQMELELGMDVAVWEFREGGDGETAVFAHK